MKIKDSASNLLVPIKESKVTIYNCGPTVYNDVHIGNIRPIITLDVIHRYLLKTNHTVRYIHNITDIDDKIVNTALAEKSTAKRISTKYYLAYKQILKKLNILTPEMPKVSDNISGIIAYIESLIKLGFAYEVQGDVYFNVSKIEKYGNISHQNLDDLLNGVRKQNKKHKQSPLDFALWKKTTDGDFWNSPWSKGRPGWHTECVCLINKYIGKQATIHAGGIDLKFPHHENENAQNIALNNIDLAKIWMHIGHVTVNDEKMAKSKKNFILAKNLIELTSPNVVKWYFYQTHYQSPLNFSSDLVERSLSDLEKIQKTVNLASLFLDNAEYIIPSVEIPSKVADFIEDNLNTPNVISFIWEKVKASSLLMARKDFLKLAQNLGELKVIFDLLGLEINTKVSMFSRLRYIRWQKAIKNKNYIKADKIRAKLNI